MGRIIDIFGNFWLNSVQHPFFVEVTVMSNFKGTLKSANREIKEFRRIESRGMVGGVCAGIAYRLGTAVWLIRLLAFLSIWAYSAGIWVYLVLCLALPDIGIAPLDYEKRIGGKTAV